MINIGKDGRFLKGMSPWNKGKQLSEEHCKNLSKSHIGISTWNKNKKGICKPNSGSFQKGENHVNYGKSGKETTGWKGGLTVIGKIIRESSKYFDWRSQVFTRDNFTCQECNTCGCYLHAHHIKPFNKIIKEFNITTLDQALQCSELWDITNGKSLCENCHKHVSTRR